MQLSFQHSSNFSEGTLIVPLRPNDPIPSGIHQKMEALGLEPQQLSAHFSGKTKEYYHLLLPGVAQPLHVYLLGLGENPTLDSVQQVFRSFVFRHKEQLPKKVTADFFHLAQEQAMVQWVEGATNGAALGGYQIGLYKSNTEVLPPFFQPDAELCIAAPLSTNEAARRGVLIAETQRRLFDLVNLPANHKTPQHLANWAVTSGEQHQFTVRVIEKSEAEAIGLHALLAVNRGSEHPAAFILMEYTHPQAKGPKVALVGKGVTFDTGGVSLKPANNMSLMKSDMGGAAAVLGTIEVAAKLQLPVNLIGIVPTTDNSIGTMAIKPSDVIQSYSGKSIEIIDTDAEGRLILADGITYALKHYQPDVLIDLATLTGSVIRSLGYSAGGLFTNNDDLAQSLTNAGEKTGERVWRFPLWKEYGDMMKSDIADIKNLSAKPIAGAITAAKFLEFFTEEHPKWAHLDIAGVATADSEFSKQRGATAFGVRLLIEYLSQLSE
jgi:leucyl aminopeptidase